MASGSYRQVEVLCPFYKQDDGKTCISCEGFGDSPRLTQRYRYKAHYLKQMEVFCQQSYKNCEVFRVLMETKYDD